MMHFSFLLALLCATAQQSYCRHVGVRLQNPFSQINGKQINTEFCGPIHPYLQTFLFVYIFFILTIFLVFVNMGPYGSKNFKHLL